MAFGRRKKAKAMWRGRGREIFLECDGDIERCEARFKEKYGSAAAILLILQIIFALWEYWNRKGISNPSYHADPDEPVEWVPDAEDSDD